MEGIAPIPLSFGLSSNRGRFLLDNSCSVENAYAEPLGKNAKNPVALYAAPGLNPTGMPLLPTGPYRGSKKIGNVLYVVSGQALYAINPNWSFREVGILPGFDHVRFALNRLAVPDVVIVSEGLVWYLKNGVLTQYVSDALPPPVDVAFVRGRFVYVHSDGRFTYSDINSMNVGGLSFYNDEGAPDGIVGIWTRRAEVWLIGATSVEVWSPTDNTDDPFSRQGGGSRPYGTYSAASIAEVKDRIFWVDNENNVRMAQGYEPVDISTPFVSRMIEAEPDKSSLVAQAYTLAGQAYYEVSGSSFTLRYSLETQQWTERKTHLRNRWRGVGAVEFGGKLVVGDIATGQLYALDKDYGYDGDEPLVMRLVTNIDHPWPAPLTIYSLHADIITAVGQNTGKGEIDEPVVMLRLSEDGGRTWFGPVPQSLGRSGQTRRVIWRQLGTWQRAGCTVELSIPAPVARCVMAALVNGQPGVS